MKSQNGCSRATLLPPLSAKELEVLWLYDCNFTDQKIVELLYLKDHEFVGIKSKLYKTFDVVDITSLLASATDMGYVHKL